MEPIMMGIQGYFYLLTIIGSSYNAVQLDVIHWVANALADELDWTGIDILGMYQRRLEEVNGNGE